MKSKNQKSSTENKGVPCGNMREFDKVMLSPYTAKQSAHTEDCLDANDDTSVLKGKCICPKKASFTPGPWHLRNNDLCVAYSDGELVSYIANVQEATLCPEHGNAQANARLIAAAPELLEASRRAIAALSANGAPNCEAVKELKAAIIKAEGGK